MTSISIPPSVTTIESSAFQQTPFHPSNALATVTFEPNSQLTSIENAVFRDCIHLTSISIPQSVSSIGGQAFYATDTLRNVTFEPDSQLTTIGPSAFQESGLTSISIPPSVTTIESNAFAFSNALATVTFEADEMYKSALTTIGDNAFNVTSVGSIVIPRNVTTIGGGAFSQSDLSQAIVNIASLGTSAFPQSVGTNQTIGGRSGVTITGYNIFTGTGTLANQNVVSSGGAISIIEGYSIIGTEAFKSVVLPKTKVVIGKSVTEIGISAFYDNNALSSVIFEPDSSLNTIDQAAFYSCGQLTSITIPKSVTSIGSNAFLECGLMTEVTFTGSSIPTFGTNAFPPTTQNITAYYTQNLSQNDIDTLKTLFKTVQSTV